MISFIIIQIFLREPCSPDCMENVIHAAIMYSMNQKRNSMLTRRQ